MRRCWMKFEINKNYVYLAKTLEEINEINLYFYNHNFRYRNIIFIVS